MGLVVGQKKDVSLFLDRTGEPATQQQVSSRLKNKDTSFSQPTTHPSCRHPELNTSTYPRGKILRTKQTIVSDQLAFVVEEHFL